MTELGRRTRRALAPLIAAWALLVGGATLADAELPTKLVVTVSDSPDPAPSGGQVSYSIVVKNDGTFKASNVVVTVPIPAGTQFVKCTNTAATPCTAANGVVTTALGKIKAHLEVRVSLTLLMPSVTSPSSVTVTADADSTDATDDRNSATTTVLAPGSFATYLPSERIAPIACGDTLGPETFGDDTTARLSGGLGCTTGPYGLKITASGKTLDLNKFKIVGATALGNVGILISDASQVTVLGGSTNGSSGIEFFDYCIKTEGTSKKVSITGVRCFRARSAGFDIGGKKASITGVLVDRAIGTTTTTAELPGGVGIRTYSDKAHIKDSIVRRTGTIGIWVAGSDTTGDGRVALIDGNTTTMRIESAAGIGLFLEGGPHSVKDVYVQGDALTGPNKDGVVIAATGVDNLLDGVVVKEFGGNGFVDDGTNTEISRSNVENVGLDGFVIGGTGAILDGNGVKQAQRGFVINGINANLDTNQVEKLDGDGFVIAGDGAILGGNSVSGNGGTGFLITGNNGLFDNNSAEANEGDGFVVDAASTGHTIKNNKSKKNQKTGFTISGSGNTLNTNAAGQNIGSEWVIAGGNTPPPPAPPNSTNKRNGSTFSFTSVGGTFD